MELHVPVMTSEILDIVESCIDGDDSTLVDATLGGGGHSGAILEKFPNLKIIGFDQDAYAGELAASRLSKFLDRIKIVPSNFYEIEEYVGEFCENGEVSCVFFDLGVSNMQISTPERGFSYQSDGPLDMRMNALADIPSAADIIERSDVHELTRIFREYGEERYASHIANAITRSRDGKTLPATTGELVSLIRRALPAPVQRKMGRHPARKIFQALRIAVNSELEALPKGLDGAYKVTRDGGVIAVISYHSLEDRIVKRTFQSWGKSGKGDIITRRPKIPSEKERRENRKSRSAKLRAFKIDKSRKNIE
ncbi:MAG: 16S rRNA (cytosine(1402)-N(4))-methyltransferase RsmH [Synergistaceae bacterium]|jgi:16S rRNA (cytosine1402-N4)-methyltransferase|nr:16S rRNA (cytosine(1402)-N(4))-methyltransferase RsmH [Synergistaceae bacterium]